MSAHTHVYLHPASAYSRPQLWAGSHSDLGPQPLLPVLGPLPDGPQKLVGGCSERVAGREADVW